MRVEPPTSEPIAKGAAQAETSAALPPLEPPLVRPVSYGFEVRPGRGRVCH
jgi:hypothetical protein